MSEFTKEDISEEFVEAVEGGEFGVGMGQNGWDFVDAREIIAATLNTYLKWGLTVPKIGQ